MDIFNMTDEELVKYIKEVRSKLKGDLIIPAHHYINRDIVELADFSGDSYKLAVDVSRSKSPFVVLCGVRFMAESAAILAAEGQHILIPEIDALCPMAEMIDANVASLALEKIQSITAKEPAPVVYMNSYADSKSLCGKRGGSVCTSSNAEKIVRKYIDEGKPVFFFPDFHLGNNVAHNLGIKDELIVKVYRDISFEEGKNLREAQIFLWDGFCPIHQQWHAEDVHKAREIYKDAKIIVHPESQKEVVLLSDISGSTQKIYETIKNSSPGSSWIIGTEFTFVDRIKHTFKDKNIYPLLESPCSNMKKITLLNTALAVQSVENFIDGKGELLNEITVSEELKKYSKVALEKMIEIGEGS
ncbi:MAG TPA: quinolinate synthase [Spirochaetota bacterium]|nr:quinolinate synthase [Spirochaetota bacterium]